MTYVLAIFTCTGTVCVISVSYNFFQDYCRVSVCVIVICDYKVSQ